MALTLGQRRKRALTLRKYQTKIQIAKSRAQRRIAGMDQLVNRSHRAAIKIVRKIVAGKMGLDYETLSVPQKMMIDDKVHKKAALVQKLAKRILPRMREREIARFRARQNMTESFVTKEILNSMNGYGLATFGNLELFKIDPLSDGSDIIQIQVNEDSTIDITVLKLTEDEDVIATQYYKNVPENATQNIFDYIMEDNNLLDESFDDFVLSMQDYYRERYGDMADSVMASVYWKMKQNKSPRELARIMDLDSGDTVDY